MPLIVTCPQFLAIDRARAIRYLKELTTTRIKLDLGQSLTRIDLIEKNVLIDRQRIVSTI